MYSPSLNVGAAPRGPLHSAHRCAQAVLPRTPPPL